MWCLVLLRGFPGDSDMSVFSTLTVLDVSGNGLSQPLSTLPLSLALRSLNLSLTNFSGTLPTLTALTGLQVLDVTGSQLSGACPRVTVSWSLPAVRVTPVWPSHGAAVPCALVQAALLVNWRD